MCMCEGRGRGMVGLTFTISCAVMDLMTDCMGQASPLHWKANLAMRRSSSSSTCGTVQNTLSQHMSTDYATTSSTVKRRHHILVTMAMRSPISLIKSVYFYPSTLEVRECESSSGTPYHCSPSQPSRPSGQQLCPSGQPSCLSGYV